MTEMPYSVAGEPGKPALFLLHGGLSSNLQWIYNRSALSQHYYLVFVELWGHGNCPMPTALQQTLPQGYVSAFEKIRKELDISSWHLVGQSYGAAVMLKYALAQPETVRSVLITNSISCVEAPDSPRLKVMAEQLTKVTSPRELRIHPIHSTTFCGELKTQLVAQADKVSMGAVAALFAAMPAMSSYADLTQLSMPLLLVNGVQEEAFQPYVDLLREHVPDIRVAEIEAGHSVNLQAPDEFNRSALQFYAEVV